MEVTAQCVKDSVREKQKFGSDKAISMAESLRASNSRHRGLPFEGTDQAEARPNAYRSSQAPRSGTLHPCRAREAALPKDAQLGDALQYDQPADSPPAPCYMCYMCYMAPNPLNLHSPPGPCYMYYMCYMALTRQAAEPPLFPSSCYMCYMCYMV